MNKLLPLSLVIITLPLIALSAANSISTSNASIREPLTESEISNITSSKKWPHAYTLKLTKVENEGLAYLNQIPELEILEIGRDANITDLSSISELKNLRVLSFNSLDSAKTAPLDLSPVAQCQQLEQLSIYSTPVTDLNTLSALSKLRVLNLYYTPIDSLEFLRSLIRLESLNIGGKEHTFKSYAPVAMLQNLRTLEMRMNPQANDESLACLSTLTELREINLSYCSEVTTLNFLKNCRELEQIECERAKGLSDIEALINMPFLTKAMFSSCPIQNISGLANKPFLEELSLVGTEVTDLRALSESMYINRLHLPETRLTDLRPLAKMQRLEYLNLSGSTADITTLPLLRKLEDIRLNETPTKDLNPLSKQPRLSVIEIRDTPVSELSPLLKLRDLSKLSVSKSIGDEVIQSLQRARPHLAIKAY